MVGGSTNVDDAGMGTRDGLRSESNGWASLVVVMLDWVIWNVRVMIAVERLFQTLNTP